MPIDPDKLLHSIASQTLRESDKRAKRNATHFQKPTKSDEELEARLVIMRANDLAIRWNEKFLSSEAASVGYWELKRRLKLQRST